MIERRRWPKQLKGAPINKKYLLIAALVGAFILGEELILPMLEELGFLIFEWAEKTMDVLFEEVFDFAPESAQKATAWTGMILIIGVLIWAAFNAYKMYLQAREAAPQWWADRKAEMKTSWTKLPLFEKLIFCAVVVGLLGLLAVAI